MNLTVSTRIEKKQTSEEKGLLWHNVRAGKNVKNIRDEDKNIKVFRFINDDIQSIELNVNNKNQNFKVLKTLQKDLDNLDKKIENDYKQEKGKKLPKNAVKMVRGVITFGSDRIEENEEKTKSLNDEEVEAINLKNAEKMDNAALKYMKELEKNFGIKISYITRHDDEKTRHYHFTATQYNFKEHKMLTSGFKKRHMQEFGENLQDLVASSFSSLDFKRGKKGSKNKHLEIKDMHSNEIKSLELKSFELGKEISKKNQILQNTDINYNAFISKKEAYDFRKNKDNFVSLDKYKTLQNRQIEIVENKNILIEKLEKDNVKNVKQLEEISHKFIELDNKYKDKALKEKAENERIIASYMNKNNELREEITELNEEIDIYKEDIEFIIDDSAKYAVKADLKADYNERVKDREYSLEEALKELEATELTAIERAKQQQANRKNSSNSSKHNMNFH